MSGSEMLFYAYSAVAVVGAVGLVTAPRLVHAVMWLFATLLAIAALFLVAGNEFVAAMQLFVYGGAITVLVLFVLMLTRQGSGPHAAEEPSPPGVRWAGFATAGTLFGAVLFALSRTELVTESRAALSTQALAEVLFSRFVLPFEVAGLLLTIALVAAIVIARDETPRTVVRGFVGRAAADSEMVATTDAPGSGSRAVVAQEGAGENA